MELHELADKWSDIAGREALIDPGDYSAIYRRCAEQLRKALHDAGPTVTRSEKEHYGGR